MYRLFTSGIFHVASSDYSSWCQAFCHCGKHPTEWLKEGKINFNSGCERFQPKVAEWVQGSSSIHGGQEWAVYLLLSLLDPSLHWRASCTLDSYLWLPSPLWKHPHGCTPTWVLLTCQVLSHPGKLMTESNSHTERESLGSKGDAAAFSEMTKMFYTDVLCGSHSHVSQLKYNMERALNFPFYCLSMTLNVKSHTL